MSQNQIVMTARHETALRYCAAGIPIFPCRVNAKEPAFTGSFYNASCDPAQIDKWWALVDWNIGLEPERAGWCVVDIDNMENWDAIAEEKPETYTVATPSGGRHLYFRGSLGGSVGKIAPGVDTRGRRSYVLVAPSTVNSVGYLVVNETEPAPLPQWLVTRLGTRPTPASAAPDIELDTPEQVATARAYLDQVYTRKGSWGQDDDPDTYAIATMVKDAGLSQDTATEMMMEPLAEDERDWLTKTVANAYLYGENEPGCGLPGSPERKYGDPSQYHILEPEPAKPLPAFRPWPSIKDAYFASPLWVWQDRLLAIEPNLYTGDSGVGKTTLAENLAVAVACGIPLLGQDTRRQPVALLVAEDHYGPVRDNLAAIACALGVAGHEGLDQIHTLSVKSDRVFGGHLLARISDDGKIEETEFFRHLMYTQPLRNSLWVIDPLKEFVAFNHLSDHACRALATGFLGPLCQAMQMTALINDHPSKASMASGDHYAGSVQLKAAFSLMATVIGGAWSGTVNKQRKISFMVTKGRYAAEDKVDFYRTSTSPAFTCGGLPGQSPADNAKRVYWHIVDRLENGERTGKTNGHDHGPGNVAHDLGMDQGDVVNAMSYCRREGWLVYESGKDPGWNHGHNRQIREAEVY